jgi:hypothetical protein
MDPMTDWAGLAEGAISTLATAVIAAFTYVLARATIRQGRATDRALLTTERAFVYLFELEIAQSWSFDPFRFGMLKLTPKWTNGGNTPTKTMSVKVNFTHWPGDLPLHVASQYGGQAATLFLGPKATELSAPIDIPGELATRVMEGGERLFVWGRADYRDIFDETPPRHTQWCYEIKILKGANNTAQVRQIMFGEANSAS